MNDNDTTLEYFKEYRAKISEMKELQQEADRLKDMVDLIRKKSVNLSREIEGMRHIITVMIDQGMDPVEAKLRTEPAERTESMWDWRDHIVTNPGAIGAIGATGVFGGAGLVSYTSATTTAATSITGGSGYGVYTISTGATGATGAQGAPYINQGAVMSHYPYPTVATGSIKYCDV